VAKMLVTTNPTLLSEHLRTSAVAPLLFLCGDVDGTNLQQFEACLSLTNLTSCGESEQDRLASEQGVGVVHGLMCSDHGMVRRAATEVRGGLTPDINVPFDIDIDIVIGIGSSIGVGIKCYCLA
jgi:hypothetical protein